MIHDAHHTSLLMDCFSRHPILGAITALLLAVLGQIVPLLDMQIPVIVMQSVQIIVWVIGAAAGILTIRGVLKKGK